MLNDVHVSQSTYVIVASLVLTKAFKSTCIPNKSLLSEKSTSGRMCRKAATESHTNASTRIPVTDVGSLTTGAQCMVHHHRTGTVSYTFFDVCKRNTFESLTVMSAVTIDVDIDVDRNILTERTKSSLEYIKYVTSEV